jgi:5-methylcytosine-specific restriction protein A
VLARDGYRCQIRGPRCVGVATQMDHVVELADGGPDTDANAQAACRPCHAAKTAAHAVSTRAKHGRRRPPRPHPSDGQAAIAPPAPSSSRAPRGVTPPPG